MAMEHPQVEFFKDRAGEYRWHIRAKNNRIICDCGEGYTRKRDCIRGYELAARYLTKELVEEVHEDSWNE